jgi:hypothetical protein
MAYILPSDIKGIRDHLLIKKHFSDYYQYLESIKDKLPKNVIDFATASWHYDPNDHKCPHDAWVESLKIIELSSGERRRNRNIEIHLQLLGAYHDGFIDLIYKGVKGYALALREVVNPESNSWHGDWLADEIRLSDDGIVIHEVEFPVGGSWKIFFTDIEYKWTPFNESEA